MIKAPLNAISLFAGGGGLDLGFSAAGYEVVYSTDIDHHSCETLKLNQGKKPFYGEHLVEEVDVRVLKPLDVLNKINRGKDDIDIILGGPPCQAFSIFGKRKGLSDPRGNLVYEYSRIIEEIQPTCFLFENVAGLRTIHEGSLYEELKEKLSFKGLYTVSAYEYNVADFGIPQFRTRVIIIGTKNGSYVPRMQPTHGSPDELIWGKLPMNTVDHALAGVPPINSQHSLFNHVGRTHSQRIVDRYSALKFGERDSMTRINRLHPERPSYTIIVGSDKGGGKGHVHPFEAREVTPRESARIQTFPDWWEFYGNGRHVIRQVGNAVPALFGSLLGAHIRSYVFGDVLNMHDIYTDACEKLELPYLINNERLLQS